MAESKEELKDLLRVKEENERAGLKLNIKKYKNKIVAYVSITSWKIKVGNVKVVTDFLFLSSKITADNDGNREIRRCLLLDR